MMKKIYQNDFLNKEVSVLPLCIFRLCFMLLICAESLSWLPYTRELFSNQGFHMGPLSAFAPAPIVTKLLCIVLVITSFSSAIGFFSKISLLITLGIWTFFFFIDHINERAFHSIAVINMIVLLISSSNARFSLDDLIKVKNKRIRLPLSVSVIPWRILQIQFCQVYFFSGLVKLASDSWVNGQTLSQILTSRWATDFGVWFSGALPAGGFYVLSVMIILYELSAGFCLFIPRVGFYFILLGLLFHTATMSMLHIGFLGPYYIMGIVILFCRYDAFNGLVSSWAKKIDYKLT